MLETPQLALPDAEHDPGDQHAGQTSHVKRETDPDQRLAGRGAPKLAGRLKIDHDALIHQARKQECSPGAGTERLNIRLQHATVEGLQIGEKNASSFSEAQFLRPNILTAAVLHCRTAGTVLAPTTSGALDLKVPLGSQ